MERHTWTSLYRTLSQSRTLCNEYPPLLISFTSPAGLAMIPFLWPWTVALCVAVCGKIAASSGVSGDQTCLNVNWIEVTSTSGGNIMREVCWGTVMKDAKVCANVSSRYISWTRCWRSSKQKRQERQVLLLSIDTLLQTYGIDTLLHTSSTAWVTLLLYKRVTLQMALVKWYKSDEKSRNCTLQIVIAKPLNHSVRNKKLS